MSLDADPSAASVLGGVADEEVPVTQLDGSDAEKIADGVIAAMVEVSAVHGPAVGEVWESESAQDVLETFQLAAEKGSALRTVFDLAMDRWPGVLSVLTGGGDQLDPAHARGHVVAAVETAREVLGPEDLETFRLAVFNVGAATAAAVARPRLGGSRDRVSDEERAVIDEIDGLFD